MKFKVSRTVTMRETFEFEAANIESAAAIVTELNDTGCEPVGFELVNTRDDDDTAFVLVS